MTREDMILMAREAGGADIESNGYTSWVGTQTTEFLERFAALIAAAEQERIKTANAPEIERVNAALNRLTEENTKLRGWYHDVEQQIAILQGRARGKTK